MPCRVELESILTPPCRRLGLPCRLAISARPRQARQYSCEADEQSGAIRCGASGAKGGDQGECGSAKTRRTQSRISVSLISSARRDVCVPQDI